MSLKPLRALIVEDSVPDAELLLIELRRCGYVVSHRRVENAEEMLRALDDERWDIVLSDYSLPQFDAPAALQLVQQRTADVPFIIVSGTIGEDTAVAALQVGANDFLVKGKLARLGPAIERALREQAEHAALRRAERELRESEERYRRIIETTNEGVWLLDSDFCTTFVNQRMVSLLGYELEEIIGRPIFTFVDERSRAPGLQGFGERELGNAGQHELSFKRKDGSELSVLLDSTPIHETAEGARTLCMVMDISQRKRLEEQLRHAQKMEAVGSLAGGVAHDFNNLLSVILTYTALTLEGLKPGDPIRNDVEQVRLAGNRARDVTRQLLAFSRRQVLEPRILDINQVLLGLEPMLRRLIGEDVDFSLLTKRTIGMVFADPGRLEQVVMNLVVNARDAMPDGGKLTIETCDVEIDEAYAAVHHDVTPGQYVMVAVSDTGSGIDAKAREHIFEPFFTTKEKGKGTGLGLSTVFGIVKQSGGHIWVYSEVSKGTTFRVYFPRTDGVAETMVPTQPPASLRGNETILVVEDEEQVRNATRLILRRQGYNVLEAQNGGEALLICEKYTAKIHLLITDVVMPRMSGKELAERLSPLRPGMKVLFVSGYTENAVVHHGVLDAGAAYFQKPITPDALARKVREVLDSTTNP